MGRPLINPGNADCDTAQSRPTDGPVDRRSGRDSGISRRGLKSAVSGGSLLPGVVGQLLTERHWTIAVAESCTGGYIAHQLTNVAGASAYFDRGIVTYSNRSKHDLLQVPADLINRHGAVSAEVAWAMAEGVRRTAGTTLGLAVTGIAGPSGGTPSKPLGTVYLALAHERGTAVEHHCLSRERIEFKMLVGSMALEMVRKHVMRSA